MSVFLYQKLLLVCTDNFMPCKYFLLPCYLKTIQDNHQYLRTVQPTTSVSEEQCLIAFFPLLFLSTIFVCLFYSSMVYKLYNNVLEFLFVSITHLSNFNYNRINFTINKQNLSTILVYSVILKMTPFNFFIHCDMLFLCYMKLKNDIIDCHIFTGISYFSSY